MDQGSKQDIYQIQPGDDFLIGKSPEIVEWFYNFSETAPDLQEAIRLVLKYTERDIDVFFRTYFGGAWLTFDSVPQEDREDFYNISILGVCVDVLFDDTAEVSNRPDILEAAIGYIKNGEFPIDIPKDKDGQKILKAFLEIWTSYEQRLEKGQNYNTLSETIHQEWVKVLESMIYSQQVNTAQIPNDRFGGFSFYDSLILIGPNMHHVAKHIEDLIFSPDLSKEDIDTAIEFALKAQFATRSGNWVKSWKQEIRQIEFGHAESRDIANGIIALAIEHMVISYEEALSLPADVVIQRISNTKFKADELVNISEFYEPAELTAEDHLYRLMWALINEIGETTQQEEYRFVGPNYATALRKTVESQLKSSEEKR